MHRCCTDLAISIHALREEGDFAASPAPCWYRLFLSTPSARRATRSTWMSVLSLPISIHALREEGDALTMPVCVDVEISIHALREEGDLRYYALMLTSTTDFYPRPPRGGRPAIAAACKTTDEFLSTPSARRAT